ncbi:MAG: hypothetical protein ACRDJ4_06630 [Actinomycetota bacterium]
MSDYGVASSELDDLVEAAEPNPLLRRVDAMCERRAWDQLVELARRCREAVDRGKQLWPIAEHIDYRLALEAPGPYAAGVLRPDAGRFALGPLTEVAASTHSFEELAAHLPLAQTIGVVAAERVVRGEDLRDRPEAHPEVLELPMVLEPWEPEYVVATYQARGLEVPSPNLPPAAGLVTTSRADEAEDPEVTRALLDLVAGWVAGSNAHAEAVVVSGSVAGAIGALGFDAARIAGLTPAEAVGWMGWAAASGGAHGRWRGAAAGRSSAWWAAAIVCDLNWPPEPDALGEEIGRLRWHRWQREGGEGGWELHLAVEDPSSGWSAAIAAEDRAAPD